MRQSIACISFSVLLVAGLIAASPKPALAYSTQSVNTYVRANDIHLDQSGNLVIQWQKIQLGFGGYTISGDPHAYILATINGTSSDPSESGVVLAYSYHPSGGGCVADQDTYAPSSQLPFGNSITVSQIWDVGLHQLVNTNTIGPTTPIYLSYVRGTAHGGTICQDGTFENVSSNFPGDGPQVYFVNSIQEPAFAFFIQPWQDEILRDFDTWQIELTSNQSTTATGILQINYGLSTSTFPFHDSSTFSIAPGETQNLDVIKTVALTFPAQTTNDIYYAEIELLNASTSLDVHLNAISFFTNPSAAPGTSNPTVPSFDQNAYNALCGYASSSFFADPAANIQITVCNTLTSAFVPTKNQQTQLGKTFADLSVKVAHKPPFGYFTAASTEISGIASSSASSSILNASSSLAMASILVPLDTGAAAFVFVLLGFWIFHRGRHIEL